jgi:hypothetical protein
MAEIIDAQIATRRELIGTAPELGGNPELDSLLDSINKHIDSFANSPLQYPQLTERMLPGLAPALNRLQQQAVGRLRAQATGEIEILKREVRLNMHKGVQQTPTVQTGDGPVIVNLGAIYGNVQQVIGNVATAGGNEELAGLLNRLAEAINSAAELGPQRSAYLEQVKFIAEQASEGPGKRQPSSIVQAVFGSLRAGLQSAANISSIVGLVGPAIARHFGIPWPF